MRLACLILVVWMSAISFSSFSQKKRKQVKEIKTDTILVFNQVDDVMYKERKVYWSEKDELILIYTQWLRSPVWDGGRMINFTIEFYQWDSIQIDKVYDIKDFLVHCEIKEVFGGYNFETPTGQIIFKAKADNRLTFQFDTQALSKDKSKLLIFRGVREFVPDY